MKVYVFGNGNLSFDDFLTLYRPALQELEPDVQFIVCDFRGVDTLVMEFLKCRTPHVSVYHMGDRPRYSPDKYRTKVSQWDWIGGFEGDAQRDAAAIEACTHFVGYDFNTNAKRTSGTLTNIRRCLKRGKIRLGPLKPDEALQ